MCLTTPDKSAEVEALSVICNRIRSKAGLYSLTIEGNKGINVVEIDNEYKEVFPNVKMKGVYRDGGHPVFHILAKAGSTLDVHRAMPSRFVFVDYGEHKETITGKIYKDGDEYKVEANGLHGANFIKDSRLIIEIR